jgi:hypothetical protein
MQQFNALPMMPIQAMTQQVQKDFSVYSDFFSSFLLALLALFYGLH